FCLLTFLRVSVTEDRHDGGRRRELLAEYAAGSEQAQNAFIEQLFNQVVKQPMLAYTSDVLKRLRQSFIASEFNVQKLLVDIATVSALHGIEKPPRAKSQALSKASSP